MFPWSPLFFGIPPNWLFQTPPREPPFPLGDSNNPHGAAGIAVARLKDFVGPVAANSQCSRTTDGFLQQKMALAAGRLPQLGVWRDSHL